MNSVPPHVGTPGQEFLNRSKVQNSIEFLFALLHLMQTSRTNGDSNCGSTIFVSENTVLYSVGESLQPQDASTSFVTTRARKLTHTHTHTATHAHTHT